MKNNDLLKCSGYSLFLYRNESTKMGFIHKIGFYMLNVFQIAVTRRRMQFSQNTGSNCRINFSGHYNYFYILAFLIKFDPRNQQSETETSVNYTQFFGFW